MGSQTINIFEILNKINTKNVDFYLKLSEENRKEISPFVLQRWLSGTSNIQQIILLNEVSNPYVFSLQKHPLLLWQLLTICTSGKQSKYFWNKLPSRSESSKPMSIQTIANYFNYSKKHAQDALQLLSYDDIMLFAQELGMQDDEISKIEREWNVSKNKKNRKTIEDEKQKRYVLFFEDI